MTQHLLDIQRLSFAYTAGKSICNALNFRVNDGDIACLLGPSGCGKTTVLRLIAGFERPLAGSIQVGGRELTSPHAFVEPEDRGIGYVFQDFALFPHLTIAKNVAFGLRNMSSEATNHRVAEMLQLVGMSKYGARYPHELSGGQRQRIALARALAPRPTLLLMDEPFSSLDIELREKLSLEVRELLKSQHITALFVTHDQNEAFSIADTVSVMNKGVIEQTDTAYNLYHRPASRFVADFVGQGVLIAGRGMADRMIDTELGNMRAADDTSVAIESGAAYDVLLRPDDIQHDDNSSTTAMVMHKAFRGADILYTLRLDSGTQLLSLVPSHHNHELGQKIGIRTEIDHVVAFPARRAT
ncbi:MAG: ABC transporter ATP-binding protein [Burkholderiales bacterium]